MLRLDAPRRCYTNVGAQSAAKMYAYADGNPVSERDPLGLFGWPSLPQGVINAGVGLGAGVIAALTLGRVSGQDVRDLIPLTSGSNGGADECSRTYDFAYKFGALDAIGAEWGAGALKLSSYAENSTKAIIVGLRLLTAPVDIAPDAGQIEQLEQVVSAAQEEGLEQPVIPPPGRPTFRY